MIWSFELFRIYFLICVMFTHLIFLVEPVNDPLSSLMSFGNGAVYFFFILSGFFMYRTLARGKPENEKESLKLIFRKTLPYFVLYWIRLILILIYQLIVYFYSGIHTYSLADIISDFFVDLSMLDVYIPQVIEDVGWYFRTLILCYIMAYPLFRAVKKLNRNQRKAVIIGLILFHLAVDHRAITAEYSQWLSYYNPYLHLADYFIGMSIAAACLDKDCNPVRQKPTLKGTLPELVSIGLVAFAQFGLPNVFPKLLMSYRYTIYLLVMTILVASFARQNGYLTIRKDSMPLLGRLRKHFFSIYILHDVMIRYSLLVPWSPSKYLNLIAAVLVIILLDDLLFLPAANKFREWVLAESSPPTQLFYSFVNNPILFYGSLLAASLLVSPVSVKFLALFFGISVAGMWYYRSRYKSEEVAFHLMEIVYAIIACTVMHQLFVGFWEDYALFDLFAERMHITTHEFTVLFGSLGAVAAFPSILYFMHIPTTVTNNLKEPEPDVSHRLSFKELFLVIVIALVTITICSKSSPLYPLNDWDDANIFFTVGKGVLAGKVPYRDLLDHKGPILYFAHTLAAAVSFRSFTGVWLVETACFIVFLIWCYKIVYLFIKDQAILTIPFIAAITVFTNCFWLGDSAEELCLPFLAITAYLFLKHYLTEAPITKRELFAVGVLTSFCFWIKYTCLGLVIGSVLCYWIDLLARKQYRDFFSSILYLALGFAVPSIPVLAYFAANHALYDLFHIYFFSNIFGYGFAVRPIHIRLLSNFTACLRHNRLLSALSVLGFVGLYIREGALRRWTIFAFCTFAFFLFFGDAFYLYYPLPMAVLLPFAAVIIFRIVSRRKAQLFVHPSRAVLLVTAGLACFCLVFRRNELTLRKEDYPQYKLLEMADIKEDTTILEYYFQGRGFYTVFGIVPECREFVRINMDADEVMRKQHDYISEKRPDYIIAENYRFSFPDYTMIASEEYTGRDEGIYYLYQKNPEE